MRPVLFSTSGFVIRAAPVFAGLAALLAYFYFHRSRSRLRLSDEDFWYLMLFFAIGVLIGAVGLYFLLYGGGPAANWERMLRFRRVLGGSFFGALWGAAAAAWLCAGWRRLDFLPIVDVLGAAALLGLAVMRLGCLMSACCYGKPTELPWGIAFHPPAPALPASLRGIPLHPTQLYESAASLGIFAFVHWWILPGVRSGRLRPGSAFLGSVALYSAFRLFADLLRGGDQGVFMVAGLGVAQVIAALSLAGVAAAWTWRAA